jgi:transcriptional regulator with GAF, ATPase, and Fis domain
MEELRRTVARVGPSASTVLITGETGTGKERVARALHLASARKGRFVAVNCAAIPAALLESELFGYEKGAFSGAAARHAGRIELAHAGTLLLDEVGDMPLELQAKLLRVIETREVERLGGSSPVLVDVRILASTHRDLGAALAEGRFREDLYYRLNVFPIEVPPLRARPDDIVPLAQAFAAELVGPLVPLTVTADGERALGAYTWPGNVRELRNFVERQSLLRPDPRAFVIDAAAPLGQGPRTQPPANVLPALGELSLRQLLEGHERRLLEAALAQCEGNIASTARLLKLDRGNLHRRLRALGLGAPATKP